MGLGILCNSQKTTTTRGIQFVCPAFVFYKTDDIQKWAFNV